MHYSDHKNDAPSAQKVGDLLARVLKRCRPPHGKAIEALRAAWGECVSSQYKTHTKVVSFSNGRLRVEISSPAVFAEIEGFGKREILECLRQKCPDINCTALQLVQAGSPAGWQR